MTCYSSAGISLYPAAWFKRIWSCFRLTCAQACWCAGLLLLCLASARAQIPAPAVLEDDVPVIDLWSGLRMLSDPGHKLRLPDVLASGAQFHPPAALHANLGRRSDTVWLMTTLDVPRNGKADWWLVLGCITIDEIDLYVVAGGQAVQHVRMGMGIAFNQRVSATRQHSARLALQPGQRYQLLLRVRKYVDSAMLVPVSLMQTSVLMKAEANSQFWQSLLFCLGMCLTAYSLITAALHRDPLYLWFALFAGSSTMLWFTYFGLAAQHLWPQASNLNADAILFFLLLLPIGGLLFVEQALALHIDYPRISRMSKILATLLTLVTLMFVARLVNGSFVMLAVVLLSSWPIFLVIPIAFRRALQRDLLAVWTVAGWVPYSTGVVITTALHRGLLPWNAWTDHAMQVGGVADALAWVMIMSVRANHLRRAAARSRLERDRLLIMAQTDPLTGLLNRRGLQDSLKMLLGKIHGHQMLALYVIDLDGFKPINDTFGHDAGDEALVLVSQRLKNAVRDEDLVCRLGGDEFVVVAMRQNNELQARQMAEKLFSCCKEPFALSAVVCELGMTIGYALAPNDAGDTELLFKYADVAMYEGKRAGKRQIRRARPAATDALRLAESA